MVGKELILNICYLYINKYQLQYIFYKNIKKIKLSIAMA